MRLAFTLSAAGLSVDDKDPVMAIGGFNGTNPTPTLAQFTRDVRRARSTTTSVVVASAVSVVAVSRQPYRLSRQKGAPRGGPARVS